MRRFSPLLLLVACAEAPSTGEPLPSSIELGDIHTCAAPQASVSYQELGVELGLETHDSMVQDHEENPALAVGDIDGDGIEELLFFPIYGLKQIYWFDGESFEQTTVENVPASVGVSLADVDLDGDTDLIVGGYTPYWLKNLRGEGPPQPIWKPLPPEWDASPIPTMPLMESSDFVHEFSPGDLDADGLIDFYMPITANYEVESDLYPDVVLSIQEDGSLLFDDEAVPYEAGLRHTFDSTWFDADADGDLDVYLANDFGALSGQSTLLRNEGGLLEDAADDCLCSLLTNAKGVDVGDFNRDGLPDLYVTGNPENALLQQLDDGTFVDVTATTGAGGVTESATGWGGIFLDYNNDGELDLLSAQGDRWNVNNDMPHLDVYPMLLRQTDGAFADVASEMGIDVLGSYRATIAHDFNQDGVLDLLLSTIEDRPLLYLSEGCTEANWLEVRAPLGARVEVTAGGETQVGWIKADSGYMAQAPLALHFGLGEFDTVERLRVVLPGGSEIETDTPIDARRRIVVSDTRVP